MHYRILLPLFAALPFAALAQSTVQDAGVAAPRNALQGGWDAKAAGSNATQWQQASERAPGSTAVQWNWFQSEYAALNSRNGGALGPRDRQELAAIAGSLKAADPNSFERHMADYYVAFPAPSAFADLEEAYRLAPGRAELLAPLLTKAMVDGDRTAMAQWSAELERRGAIASSLTEAAQDMLSSLPDRAVLFTNGEMDTQPALVRQLQHSLRPGVLLVDRRLLADAAYRTRIWRELGRPWPVPADGPPFARALATEPKQSGPEEPPRRGTQAQARPVYFALGLDRSWLDAVHGQLHAVGAAFRVGPPDAADAANLARNWARMKKPLDAGPMSRNYLVPGAMLLKQLRQQGQAEEADTLEQELGRMAAATGAAGQLQQLGIIRP